MTNRVSENPFDAPASSAAHIEHGLGNSENLGPFRKALGYAVKGKATIVAAVSHLLFTSRPSNIAGFIVPVVVDPFKRVLVGGTGANVTVEVAEALPIRVEGDASASVVFEGRNVGIGASVFHMLPSPILRGANHAVFDVANSLHGHSITS